ncbi:MAG: PilZ domain-containing protein [Desulfobulbaceae bacterium]|nr:PilZ domain-containing protein [Desulfobulbaceae bacterium]
MSENNDKRVCSRTLFLTDVRLRVKSSDVEIEADLFDISISGMYVQAKQTLPVGTLCTIVIKLCGNHSCLVLEDIHGEVVRQDKQGVAIHFTSPMEWFVLFKVYTHYGR